MVVGCFDPIAAAGRRMMMMMMVRHAIDWRLLPLLVGRVEDDCGVNKVLQFFSTLLGGFFNAVRDTFLNCGNRQVRSVGNV